jgi:mannose-6-phosphate isomerase-like protein (cupin superfamily)
MATANLSAQYLLRPDTVGGKVQAESLFNRRLFGDSLVTSFCIIIPTEVKAHKHASHSEHVMVIEGEGRMRIGNENLTVKAGDLIFIPANTVHSVRSIGKVPLKVLSIQAPQFDGTDRIFVKE